MIFPSLIPTSMVEGSPCHVQLQLCLDEWCRRIRAQAGLQNVTPEFHGTPSLAAGGPHFGGRGGGPLSHSSPAAADVCIKE